MMRFFRFANVIRACLVAVALAVAQAPSGPADAQEMFKQIPLTEAHIKGFIAAQADMIAISEKMSNAPADKPDPKIQDELDAAAKKHGFKDFADYDDVAANIAMIMAGIDPQTGAFTDPLTALKAEIEEVKKDTSLSEANKKQMLDELNEALKTTEPIKYPENVTLVTKHRADIDKVLQ